MRTLRFALAILIAFAVTTGVANASWYDDYEAGLAAVRKGDWKTAADRMTKAIAGNPNENNKARTYGAIFINYHPYYYRGAANLNLGRYEQAVADLEKTTGPGPENLGSIDMLMQMAKMRLAQSNEPEPVPQPQITVPVPSPQPVVPVPVPQPVLPAIDAALRGRAQTAIQQARSRLEAAQDRDATATQQYQNALSQFTSANTRLATAKSNDDLNAVIAMADNAALIADSAVVPTPPGTTRPNVAADTVMAESSRRVRRALESYFRGDFDEAAQMFSSLADDMPTNGWIWAFLGASQYSQYAFEADEQYRAQALEAFRKARRYGRWGRDGLPSKYFSRRIRRAFNETAG